MENQENKQDQTQDQTEDQKKIHELTTKLDDCNAKIETQEAVIAELKEKNKRLVSLVGQNQREAVVIEAPKRSKPTVEVDGTQYKFRFGAFAFEGVHYESQDAALDEKLLSKIIATKGQSILKQIF